MPTGEFPRMAVRGTALPEVMRKMGGGGGGIGELYEPFMKEEKEKTTFYKSIEIRIFVIFLDDSL